MEYLKSISWVFAPSKLLMVRIIIIAVVAVTYLLRGSQTREITGGKCVNECFQIEIN